MEVSYELPRTWKLTHEIGRIKLRVRGWGIEQRSITHQIITMATNQKPVFGYVVLYVKDVAASVAFYSKAFGYDVRRLDESHRLNNVIMFISRIKLRILRRVYLINLNLDGESWKRGTQLSLSLRFTSTRPIIWPVRSTALDPAEKGHPWRFVLFTPTLMLLTR